jgi:hypothetical protein
MTGTVTPLGRGQGSRSWQGSVEQSSHRDEVGVFEAVFLEKVL